MMLSLCLTVYYILRNHRSDFLIRVYFYIYIFILPNVEYPDKLCYVALYQCLYRLPKNPFTSIWYKRMPDVCTRITLKKQNMERQRYIDELIEESRTPFLTIQTTLNDSKIVSEYDQEIPSSQTTDNLTAPRGRAAQPP